MKEMSEENRRRDRERVRRAMEVVASAGLLLVLVAMVSPFIGVPSAKWVSACRWIYAAGALIYFIARFVSSLDKGESLRLRRFRRMETWAGVAFALGAFFWFYNSRGMGGVVSFRMMGETVAFTMAGAVIQLIASWMIVSAQKKKS